MLNYIKKVFSHWIILLGLIPWLYDFISAYFHLEFQLPHWAIYTFAGIGFFYASFKTYQDEYERRTELEKSPTNYEIRVILNPIDFKAEETLLLEQLDNIEKAAKRKLKSLPDRLRTDPLAEAMISSYNTKTNTQYNNELDIYEIELEELINGIEEKRIKVKEYIKSWEDQFFFIQFTIENIGIKSDTEIQIEIKSNNKNIVFPSLLQSQHGLSTYDLLPNLPKEPEEPKIEIPPIYNSDFMSNGFLDNLRDFDFELPGAFRKNKKIEDEKYSIELRDLHVGDKVDIFQEQLIIKLNDDIQFSATIKSKESTKVLKPDPIIKWSDIKLPLYDREK